MPAVFSLDVFIRAFRLTTVSTETEIYCSVCEGEVLSVRTNSRATQPRSKRARESKVRELAHTKNIAGALGQLTVCRMKPLKSAIKTSFRTNPCWVQEPISPRSVAVKVFRYSAKPVCTSWSLHDAFTTNPIHIPTQPESG